VSLRHIHAGLILADEGHVFRKAQAYAKKNYDHIAILMLNTTYCFETISLSSTNSAGGYSGSSSSA